MRTENDTGKNRLIFLLKFAWEKGSRLCFIELAKSIFDAASPLATVFAMGAIVQGLQNRYPLSRMTRVVFLYIGLTFALRLIISLLQYFENVYIRKISNVMQYEFYTDALHIDYHHIQDGSFWNLRQKAMSLNPSVSFSAFSSLLNQIFQFAAIAYILLRLSPPFLAVMLVLTAGYIFFSIKSKNLDYGLRVERVENDRRIEYLYKLMTEYRYAKEIRMNRASDMVAGKYAREGTKLLALLQRHHARILRAGLGGAAITVAQSAAMYLYFTHQAARGQITIAEYTVLLGSTTLLISVFATAFDNIASIRNLCRDADFYRQYTQAVAQKSGIDKRRGLPEANIPFAHAEIRFENVTFRYPGGDRDVLQDVSFTLRPGERVGIVGENGSGKTTLIKLLVRLYDPDQGKITLGGVDIRAIPHAQYVRQIGIVLQDYTVFAYSVLENIVFGAEPDMAKIAMCLEKSGLGEKIRGLPKGLDTCVGRQLQDDGIEFSGGEGQKLAIAKAAYRDMSILILDEPTSALDPLSEEAIFARMDELAAGKSTVYISHRLSSTRFCHKIIVLRSGRIAETGSHEELMKRGGPYAELYKLQGQYYKSAGGKEGAAAYET